MKINPLSTKNARKLLKSVAVTTRPNVLLEAQLLRQIILGDRAHEIGMEAITALESSSMHAHSKLRKTVGAVNRR